MTVIHTVERGDFVLLSTSEGCTGIGVVVDKTNSPSPLITARIVWITLLDHQQRSVNPETYRAQSDCFARIEYERFRDLLQSHCDRMFCDVLLDLQRWRQ